MTSGPVTKIKGDWEGSLWIIKIMRVGEGLIIYLKQIYNWDRIDY